MKKRGRKQYSADLKAKIAVEAVKGQRTIQEIASHYEVHPNMVTKWKKQVLDGVSEILSNGRAQASEADEQVQAELYQQIGKLQVEVAKGRVIRRETARSPIDKEHGVTRGVTGSISRARCPNTLRPSGKIIPVTIPRLVTEIAEASASVYDVLPS